MKKSHNVFILSFFLFSAIFFSCVKSSSKNDSPLEIPDLVYEKSLPIEYAQEFRADIYIEKAGSFSSQETSETSLPVQTKQSETSSSSRPERSGMEETTPAQYVLLTVSSTDRYLLIPQGGSAPKNLSPEITILKLPLQNIYLAATSAMSLICALDSLDSIRFSSVQKNDWFVDEAKDAMEEGRILFAGKYNAPDFEFLLKEKCSLALESTMIYHTPQIKEKLESLGIPVFVDKSSYEENPLGRLEWIKVYGLLTGKFFEADSFFAEEMRKISRQVRNESDSAYPTIAFFYVAPSGLVIIRGNDDYIVKMIEMAGGTYICPDIKIKGKSPSVQISMEQFYAACAGADVLIYNASIDNTLYSKDGLLEKSPLFSDFKAFRSGQIYITEKSLYQSTDKIGEVILDLHSIVTGQNRELKFLRKIDSAKE